METYKKLGFNSEYEQTLYEDVCCELNNIKDLKETEDITKLLRRVNGIKVHTKEDYEEFISKKGLNDLFEKVKYMSLFDRYVELYIYHANCFLIHNQLTLLCVESANTSKEMGNGEEYIKNLNTSATLYDQATTHLHCIKYIFSKVHNDIPFLEDFFYKATDKIHCEVFFNGESNENGNKLEQ